MEQKQETSNNSPNPPPAYPSQYGPSPPMMTQQQPYPGAPPVSAAQMGQQYRSELYAQCAQGTHVRTTRFGLCGILTAIFCFPIGLICLCLDTDKVCARCGVRL